MKHWRGPALAMLAHSDYHSLWQVTCFEFHTIEFAIEAVNGRTMSIAGACTPEVSPIPVALGNFTSSINSRSVATDTPAPDIDVALRLYDWLLIDPSAGPTWEGDLIRLPL